MAWRENLTKGMRVLEHCNDARAMTDGDAEHYSCTSGYTGIHWPGYLTIDLGRNQPLGIIRFLLWNHKEDRSEGSGERRYYFRLLTAEDYGDSYKSDIEWKVVHDSGREGYRGWQVFRFDKPHSARYIRIHAVYNSKNTGFHVVEFEAYLHDEVCKDSLPAGLERMLAEPQLPQEAPVDATRVRTVFGNEFPVEIGDGFTLSKRLYDISSVIGQTNLAGICIDKSIIDKAIGVDNLGLIPYAENPAQYNLTTDKVCKIIQSVADDIGMVETNAGGVERVIVRPVATRLYRSGTNSYWWAVVGLSVSMASILLGFII